MFPFLTRRSTRRSRRTVSGVTRLFETTAKAARKATETATRQALRDAAKAAKAATAPVARPVRRAASKPEPAPKAPGRFVEVDGLRVHVIVRGRGRPVLLLHGNGTMAEDYLICGLIERLATRYRVIAVDRPGFGHTGRPRARIWTAPVQARLIHGVLEALKVERPLVVGHSWGTLVALALAAGGWRRLRGLVLLSGYYYPSRRADVAMSAALGAFPAVGDAARSLMTPALARLAAAQSFRQIFRPQPVPAGFEAGFPVAIAIGATQLRAVSEDAATMNAAASGLQPSYPGLSLPMAILTGDADAVVDPAEQSCRLHAEIPGSTLTILPGLGHMIHYAALDPVERAIDGLMAPAGRGVPPGRR